MSRSPRRKIKKSNYTPYTPEQVVYALKQHESGESVASLCRKMAVSEATVYNLKKKYACMGVGDVRELRQLREENTKLKQWWPISVSTSTCCRRFWQKSSEACPQEGTGRVAEGCVRYQLQLRRKKRRVKRASHSRVAQERATMANQRWSKDFVTDRLENGSYFRILTVVDQYTRECLALHAGHSMIRPDVALCLSRVVDERGSSSSITVDNGSEFYSQKMDHWAYRNQVELDFIRPGKPVENHYIESFNGRLRDEFLNTHLFFDSLDAQEKLDRWKHDYNVIRPHGSLGKFTPEEFARKHQTKKQKRNSLAGKS